MPEIVIENIKRFEESIMFNTKLCTREMLVKWTCTV